MFLVSTLFFGVLLISVARGRRDCADCTKISECEFAMSQVQNANMNERQRLVANSLCGYEEQIPKICCSDFIGHVDMRFGNQNELESGDNIENHRNVRLLPEECGDISGNRILGGSAAALYQFPWMVLIGYNGTAGGKKEFKCGGTLINSRYVLTAAHCTNDLLFDVRIGEYDLSKDIDCMEEDFEECPSYEDIPVTHKIVHNQYSINKVLREPVNDIALLRLKKTVIFSINVAPICLPVTKDLLEKDLTNEMGYVAGWGSTEHNTHHSDILLVVELPIYSPNMCSTFFKSNKKKSTALLCAGEDGRDSCKGDSGGPLMVQTLYSTTYKYIQYGIVSYGRAMCGKDSPGVYTDVRLFMKWILDTIKP